MGYAVTHVIDTDVENFWRLFFNVDLAREMLKSLGVPGGFEIVEEREDEQGRMHRRIECSSNVELPEFIKKLVGDGSYTEVGCYDPAVPKYSAQCIPKRGADKFSVSFEVTVRPVGDGTRCERHIVTENVVKVFGIGGMIQSIIERSQRDAHEQSAKFINSWLRSKRT